MPDPQMTTEIRKGTVSIARPCRGCGASIVFAERVAAKTPHAKTPFRAPLTILQERRDPHLGIDVLLIVDTNHFIDCPAATRFRR